MKNQQIKALNDAEKAWVADELSNARLLVETVCPDDAEAPLTPEVLDRAYAVAREMADPDEANAVVAAVGIAFGQHVVDALGFEWAAVSDEYGTDLAVVGLPGQANVLVFPADLVAKRWESGETGFLVEVYGAVAASLEQARAMWRGKPGAR